LWSLSLPGLVFGLLALPLTAQDATAAAGDLQPEVGHLLPPPSATPKSLRAVSFNVHYAHDVPALAKSIRASSVLNKADLLLLQEIESHPSEGTSRTRQLAEALCLNYVYAPARKTEEGGTHGLAVLSRFPLRAVEVLPLPRYDLGYNTRRRIALGVTVDVNKHPLRVYNVHLDTRINTQDRLAQVRPVVEAAQGAPLQEVIIGGDFNTNPFRWLFHRMPVFRSNQAGALDQYMQENGFTTPLAESGSTVNRLLVRARVDSLYARGLTAQESGVERSIDSSDHHPVWLDLAWPPATPTSRGEP
jgi:endonuclease/exonuclease/phosphatase family metal-dependent hydrolase